MARKSFLCIALFCLVATTASAEAFSFTGTFQTDNDVELLSFTIGAETTVTFLTLSYAGGTNAADQVIPAGGFDPLLTLFDPSGNEIGAFDNGGPGQVGLGPDGYLDSYGSEDLLAGTYTLALTESPNYSLDGTLGDGFPGGGPYYPCTDNADFCDFAGNALDGNWAVDILGADSALDESQSTGTPEPGSLILLSSGLACFSWVRRRWATHAACQK
jgi:hypothetical protein